MVVKILLKTVRREDPIEINYVIFHDLKFT